MVNWHRTDNGERKVALGDITRVTKKKRVSWGGEEMKHIVIQIVQ